MPSTIGWLSSMKRLTSVMVARRSALCESRSRLANQRTRTRLDQTGSRSVRPRAKDFNHLHTGPQGPLFDPLISPVLGQDPDLTLKGATRSYLLFHSRKQDVGALRCPQLSRTMRRQPWRHPLGVRVSQAKAFL